MMAADAAATALKAGRAHVALTAYPEAFRESWRQELLSRAWKALEHHQQQTGQPYYDVLHFRVQHPDLPSPKLAEQLSTRLGRSVSATSVRQLLHRARERFAELLLDEIRVSLEGRPSREQLQEVQRLREDDVRTLHRLQLGAQRVLLSQSSRNPLVRWAVPRLLPLILRSPLLPRVQRRLFFGAPLPPLDPAFSFREGATR